MANIYGRFFDDLGDTFQLKIPFQGPFVITRDPEVAKTLLANDGPTPYQMALDDLKYYRKTLRKDMFPGRGKF